MLKKAAIGSGFPVGIAEDLSAGGVWLCARGLDGVGAVVGAIATEFGPHLEWKPGSTTVRSTDASVASCGSSPFELLVARDIEQVVVKRPDAPLILVGLAGVVAQANDTRFALEVDGGAPIIVTPESVMWEGDLSSDGIRTINITEVERVDGESVGSPVTPQAVEVDERQWAAATELAARTYVAASEESRVRGAGAGLSDND